MVTINDVSKRAAVSRSTVSRYISKNGYVSEPAAEAIETAIRDLGFRPNRNARALRSSRSNILGGVVTDLASPFYAQLVSGMQMACKKAGKGLLLTSGFGEAAEEDRAILELVDRSCDGLLLNLEFPLSKAARDALRKAGLPYVMIGCGGGDEASGSVRLENRAGACRMMEHLLQLGHRRILHIAGSPQHVDTADRIAGIEQALRDAGLGPDTVTVDAGDYVEEHGHAAILRHFGQGRPFTAVFAGDDDIAAGALMALRGLGLDVPGDVSLAGFDDNFHARHLSPALTTIRQPIGDAGARAVDLLIAVLEDQAPVQTDILLPTELITRTSTAVAAG